MEKRILYLVFIIIFSSIYCSCKHNDSSPTDVLEIVNDRTYFYISSRKDQNNSTYYCVTECSGILVNGEKAEVYEICPIKNDGSSLYFTLKPGILSSDWLDTYIGKPGNVEISHTKSPLILDQNILDQIEVETEDVESKCSHNSSRSSNANIVEFKRKDTNSAITTRYKYGICIDENSVHRAIMHMKEDKTIDAVYTVDKFESPKTYTDLNIPKGYRLPTSGECTSKNVDNLILAFVGYREDIWNISYNPNAINKNGIITDDFWIQNDSNYCQEDSVDNVSTCSISYDETSADKPLFSGTLSCSRKDSRFRYMMLVKDPINTSTSKCYSSKIIDFIIHIFDSTQAYMSKKNK